MGFILNPDQNEHHLQPLIKDKFNQFLYPSYHSEKNKATYFCDIIDNFHNLPLEIKTFNFQHNPTRVTGTAQILYR